MPLLHIAIPVMNEESYLEACLEAIGQQEYKNYRVYICVNQPEAWWHMDEKVSVCESNKRLLDKLKNTSYVVIDKSTKGCGWDAKNYGVGWARKTLMDSINTQAAPNDIIVSLDADTVFGPHYFSSIVEIFKNCPNAAALANPYYHRLSGESILDKAMLRYEIYMRFYSINLWHIHSPYAFTALGSAIALPVATYRRIGGLSPKKSGEDFYFLQKIRKYGKIVTWNTEKVYPATRFSDRVFFGTGPALIKGSEGQWKSYPIYRKVYFDNIKNTYDLFPSLYKQNMPTPLDDFLVHCFGTHDIWTPLRANTHSLKTFLAACHQKLDGLRILQYLKWQQDIDNYCDNEAFKENMLSLDTPYPFDNLTSFSFEKACINTLNDIRDFLVHIEEKLQLNDF